LRLLRYYTTKKCVCQWPWDKFTNVSKTYLSEEKKRDSFIRSVLSACLFVVFLVFKKTVFVFLRREPYIFLEYR